MPNKSEKHKYRELVTKMLDEVMSLVAQAVKNFSAMQATQGLSLCQENPLEGMAAHSSVFLPGKSCGQRPGRLQSKGLQRVGHHRQLTL